MAKISPAKINITRKDIKKIAALARLELDVKNINEFIENFKGTLAWVSKLQEINVADIDETSQVTGLSNVFRPDKIEPSQARDTFLKDAPASQASQLKVRAIFSE